MTDKILCPICAVAFKPDDRCATDIELGTCHAACLQGSPVVDLETGEETGGKVDTYCFSEVMDPPPQTRVKALEWTVCSSPKGVLVAVSVAGDYVIRPRDAGDVRLALPETSGWTRHPSVTEAKQVAQAAFERRILSALATTEGSK